MSEEVFMTYNAKNIVIWTYVIGDLNGEETTGTFYEKELQNTRDRDPKVPNFSNKRPGRLFDFWRFFVELLLQRSIKKRGAFI